MASSTSRIRRPRATALALTAAVATVTALVPASPATAAGYPTVAGPWSAATALTGADGQQTLIDVKTADDGTTFALWRDRAADSTNWNFDVAVKTAASSTWGAAHTLATGRESTSPAVLTVTPGGQAVVTWVEGKYVDDDLAAVAATWTPAQGGWSDPTPIIAADPDDTYLGLPRLASAADGTLTAVWVQGSFNDYKVMTATRAPGATAWSTAQPLASVTTGSVYDFALAVAPDGSATAVWDVYDQDATGNRFTDFTATRPTAGGSWSDAAVLPGVGYTTGDVQVASDAQGVTTVLWHGADAADDGYDLSSVTRTSASASWGDVQTAVASTFNYSDGSDPLIAPNGDLTYVWAGWSNADRETVVKSVTRSASTGAWSAPQTLSTGFVPFDVDASIGADGTVQVVWPQVPSIDNSDVFSLEWAFRADGTWSKATALSSAPAVSGTDALYGEVAAGPDGRATVLSRKAVGDGDFTSQVSAQWQTLLTKPHDHLEGQAERDRPYRLHGDLQRGLDRHRRQGRLVLAARRQGHLRCHRQDPRPDRLRLQAQAVLPGHGHQQRRVHALHLHRRHGRGRRRPEGHQGGRDHRHGQGRPQAHRRPRHLVAYGHLVHVRLEARRQDHQWSHQVDVRPGEGGQGAQDHREGDGQAVRLDERFGDDARGRRALRAVGREAPGRVPIASRSALPDVRSGESRRPG